MKHPIPLPTTICDDCVETATAGLLNGCGFAIIHCAHESTGAIYEEQLGLWRSFSPITSEKFADFLEREFMARAALAKLTAEVH